MHFSKEEQEEIRSKMYTEGIRLLKEYGVQRLTVDKLTKSCEIAKGSFYHFYDSKESYLLDLIQYAGIQTQQMLQRSLRGRSQMTTHEFFEFYREYLYSDYDLLQFITIEDFLWIQKHLINADHFKARNQIQKMDAWLSMMSDARTDLDKGMVVNLIKSIYGLREMKDNMVQESVDATIEFILTHLEEYITENA